MRILVTGAAGFIGARLSERLLARGDEVIGVDNLNDYYDPNLKQARLARLTPLSGFQFEQRDIADRPALEAVFKTYRPSRVVNLAAQAGVRYSLENPRLYRGQHRGFHECPGGLSSLRGRAPGVRLQQFRVRRQYQHAVFGA